MRAIAAAGVGSGVSQAARGKAVRLYVDLEVAEGREEEMAANYHNLFKPVIGEQPGFVEVELMKLRQVLVGKNPTTATHRLLIRFETEEQRLAWIATDDHQRVWPAIGKTLAGMEFNALLYDEI